MIFLCNFLFLDKVANIALPTPARSDQDMLSHHLRSRATILPPYYLKRQQSPEYFLFKE